MKLLRRSFIVLLVFTLAATLFATNPPNKGKFPKNFWRTVLANPELFQYGDPAWAARMNARKLLRMKMAAGQMPKTALAVDQFKLPVLLGEYSDKVTTFSAAEFQNLLFDNNPTGTVTEYFDEISYGQFALEGVVHGAFQADQNQAFYAGTNNGRGGTFPQNSAGFVHAIASKADPTVDFSQYDNDGPDGVPNSGDDDGFVDGLMVIYPGAGADWFPGNDNLWPHMRSLGGDQLTTNDASANGGFVKINAFAITPELAGGGTGRTEMRPIGVFAHEFGHLLGLPDLYDRTDETEGPDFNSSEGIGEWCLMATGSWGGNGSRTETPAHMSAWCKIQMGWITPTFLTSDVNGLTINQAETNPEAYVLWEDGFEFSRYFLVENRQKTGFDRFLNGAGLLVFHVDENQRWGGLRWSFGQVNDDETHKLLDIEAADGKQDLDFNRNRGDSGDPFPGNENNQEFSTLSTPNSLDYDGAETGVAISNISNSGAVMTADVKVRQNLGYGLAYDENGITGWGWGLQQDVDSWSGVVFTSAQAGTVKVVDVGFRNSPNTYELKVFRTLENGAPVDLLASASGQAQTSGWHSISLDGDGAVVGANQDFFVSVKIDGRQFAHAYDRWGDNSGRSWFSDNGNFFNNSLRTSATGGDLNIRARIQTNGLATSIGEEIAAVPLAYRLEQNHPNPFNPSTTIPFSIAQQEHVSIEIYDMLGKKVTTLIAGKREAGNHQVDWNATGQASGVYFYKLTAGDFSQTRKLILLR